MNASVTTNNLNVNVTNNLHCNTINGIIEDLTGKSIIHIQMKIHYYIKRMFVIIFFFISKVKIRQSTMMHLSKTLMRKILLKRKQVLQNKIARREKRKKEKQFYAILQPQSNHLRVISGKIIFNFRNYFNLYKFIVKIAKLFIKNDFNFFFVCIKGFLMIEEKKLEMKTHQCHFLKLQNNWQRNGIHYQ